MKLCWSLILRPLYFIILLALSGFIFWKLFVMSEQTKHIENLQFIEAHNRSLSEIEAISRLLVPRNELGSNLARVLSYSLNGTEVSYQAIQTQVAPTLFLACSTVPEVSEVSYIGLSGLIFSFYMDENQTLAAFSNTSFSSKLYTQPVDRDSGKLYGEAISSKSVIDAGWLQERMKSTISHHSLGFGWINHQDLLFHDCVKMDGRGIIRVSFSTQFVINHFSCLNFNGGDFHLATNDGQVLIRSKIPDINIVVNNGTVAVQLLKPNGDFEDGENHYLRYGEDDDSNKNQGTIIGNNYMFYCSTIEILGVKSVYTLAFPLHGMEAITHRNSTLTITLLVLLFVILVVALCIFIVLKIKSARREMLLRHAHNIQKKSTQQAERKSMKKSLAFAKASHEIRNSLEAISVYVKGCQEDANPNSQLASKLVQMNTCKEDMLGILNSVLDSCKIEAGKMQLKEEEFNLGQLLEDAVDVFYPLGMKKDVDVVFDPCDGSILKLSYVKGDRAKLKQILYNLLSNAVKFTSEGHVSVRAMANKTTSKMNAIMASNSNGVFNCLLSLWCKKNESLGDLEGIHTIQHDPNLMEFVFEVDDTGEGIPKEKQRSVFENYVQIKETALGEGGCGLEETALGEGGCGLGLGIVQSLVRLMGGEISIVDKEPGERGTCFRFNIFLATREDVDEQENIVLKDGPYGSHQYFRLQVRSPSLKSEGSHVILLLAGEERRRVASKVIENLGIKVSLLKRAKYMSDFLETSFGRCEFTTLDLMNMNRSSSSHSSTGRASDESAVSDKEGQPHYKKHSSKSSSQNFVLIVIDSRAAPFPELCSIVANLKGDHQKSRSQLVVWLENPSVLKSSMGNLKAAEDRPPPPCDHILSKPFHGSHLYSILRFLPEFGGTNYISIPRIKVDRAQEMQHTRDQDTLVELICTNPHKHEIQEIVVLKCEERNMKTPLSGKKILVVDDSATLRMSSGAQFSNLGAMVDVCENGKQAFDHVCKVLHNQRIEGCSEIFPYNYIFMDCEMPIMSGYEATKLIREEEKRYGIRIPIIALTANEGEEVKKKIKDAGMDFHLTKPLKLDLLRDAISFIQSAARGQP